MLIQYLVSNFKSIGHNIEFNMFPVDSTISEEYVKVLTTKNNGTWQILKRSGFFGPNAAGKSSFIESIEFARKFIVEGQKSETNININQFKGTIEELQGMSTFQFVFYLDENIYEYGFSLNRRQVCEEWLMLMTKNGFMPMFMRKTNKNGKTEIEITSKFARNNTKDRELSEILKDSIQIKQRNQLFLYKLYDNGIKKAERIISWFKNIHVIFPRSKIRALPIQLKKNDNLRTYIGEMLNKMDTGVFNISVASKEIDFNEYATRLQIPEEIVETIEKVKNGIVNLMGKIFIFGEDNTNKTVLIQLHFTHLLNGKQVEFDIEDESDGTKRLLDLLPLFFMVSEDSNALFFIDEIDRSLHTKLSVYLMNEFRRMCKETQNQIIFTAHDVNLINTEVFLPQEIWFIEKDKNGESRLRPLSDFNIKGQDTLKAYLNGRFGAVPVIRGNM